MKDIKVNYKGVQCSVYHITKECYGYEGKDRYELWSSTGDSSYEELQSKGFIYFDRGLFYMKIQDELAKDLMENNRI